METWTSGYLTIYDLTDDSLRTQVREFLKDYGLTRIQYSAFLGYLRRDRLNSLMTDLKTLLADKTENVQIYPLCDLRFQGHRGVGKPKKYEHTDEKPHVIYVRGNHQEG